MAATVVRLVEALQRDYDAKRDFLGRLRGIPETVFYDLFTIFRSLSNQDEKEAAANRLAKAYFKAPMAKPRWKCFKEQIQQEIGERAKSWGVSREDVLAQSTKAAICLAVAAMDGKPSDYPRAVTDVPEWGGQMYLCSLSPSDRKTLEESGRMNDAAIVARAIVDEKGQRILSDDDEKLLNQKSGAVLRRLAKIVMEMEKDFHNNEPLQRGLLQSVRRKVNEAITEDLVVTYRSDLARKRVDSLDKSITDDAEYSLADTIGTDDPNFAETELELTLEAMMAVSGLAPEEITIFIRHEFEGQELATIAKELGIPESGVRVKNLRTKKKLQKYFPTL